MTLFGDLFWKLGTFVKLYLVLKWRFYVYDKIPKIPENVIM